MRSYLSLACVLLIPAIASALATEQIGNGPINQSFGLAPDVMDIANMDSRVYWYEVNANPTFYFKGDAKELRKALAKFAALKHERKEIILFAGHGKTRTLSRDQEIPFGWSFHVPNGFSFRGKSEVDDNRATLTIHLPALRGKPPEKPEELAKWIADLSNDQFKTRAQAEKNIEDLGVAALPAIQKALEAKPSAEAVSRLERLRDRAGQNLSVGILDIPPGIPVIGYEALLKRSQTEIENKSPEVRAYAISTIPAEQTTTEELLAFYEKVLAKEQENYPILCALGGISRMESKAKSLKPLIEKLQKSEDKNVRNASEAAIKSIEKTEVTTATPDPKLELIRREISEFVAQRVKK